MRNIITTFALVASAAAPAIAAPAEAGFSGKVVGPDGKALASVFVQQQGAINSAITDDKGTFTLKLDPKGRQGNGRRAQQVNSGSRGFDGLAVNGLVADARYRVGDIVFGLAGYRVKAPIQITPLSTQPSAVPSVDLSAWNLSAGYTMRMAD